MKRREILFLQHAYKQYNRSDNHMQRPTKIFVNYMNKFSISEDDAFDIAGVHNLFSLSEGSFNWIETKRKLSASEQVYIFVSGLQIFDTSRESYLIILKKLVDDVISNLEASKIENVQLSFIELIYFGEYPIPRTRIDKRWAEDLYRRQNAEMMSFNNQVEILYEDCLQNIGHLRSHFELSGTSFLNFVVLNGKFGFFITEKLENADFQSLKDAYLSKKIDEFEREQKLLRDKILEKYKRHLTDPVGTTFEFDFREELAAEEEKLQIAFDLAIEKSERQDHRLFQGYQATISIFPYSRMPIGNELWEIIKTFRDQKDNQVRGIQIGLNPEEESKNDFFIPLLKYIKKFSDIIILNKTS